MASFLADEDFPLPVVTILRAYGHDLVTAHEAGLANMKWTDDSFLKHAMSEKRIVLTHNRDHFHQLHRRLPNHSGIVTCTRDRDSAALAVRIDKAVRAVDSVAGRLIKV